MTPFSLFGGKVLKQTLTVFEGRPPQVAPRLKRLLLPQGELTQFHDGEPGIRYLAWLALVPGTVRGNHYHKAKEEWLYVGSGELEVLVEDLESNVRQAVALQPGELLIIQTGVAHALRVTRAGHAVEFSPSAFDPADIHPFVLT